MELWFVYALTAAGLWGFSYALSEQVLKETISPSVILLIYTFLATPVYFSIAYKNGSLSKSFEKISHTPKLSFFLFLIAASYIVANFLIFKSVSLKNATLVAFIEISYPLFTALFVCLIAKETQLNWGTVIGGLLMMAGSLVIYKFAP